MVSQNKIVNQITSKDIENWLVDYLANLLKLNHEEIDVKIPFQRFGVDSLLLVTMVSHLEEWLEIEILPTIMYDYPTIKTLSEYLAQEITEIN